MSTEQRPALGIRLAAMLAATVVTVSCSAGVEKKAKELVAAQLFDPSSAQFRNLYVSTRNPGVICGEVNGKNRFGGYVGFRRFVANTNVSVAEIDPAATYSPETRQVFGELTSGIMDTPAFDRYYAAEC